MSMLISCINPGDHLLLSSTNVSVVENKNTKKGNAMYYPRFTKLIVNFVMAKDPLIPRRNKVNWHYARDDPTFTTINVISRNEDTQLYGTILPAELTNEGLRTLNLIKSPRMKGKKTGKGKQKAKELETISEAILTEAEQLNANHQEKLDEKRLHLSCQRVLSSSVSSGFVSNMLNPNQDTSVDVIFGHNAEATSLVNIPVTAIAEPSFFAPTNHPLTPTPLFTQLQQPQILTLATTPSSSLQNLPDFGSLFGFDNRLKALEDNFSEFKQTNQYAEALSSIPGIVDQYLANKMKEAVDVAVQLKSDRIREEAQAENQQFLDSIDEGMKKVIKEQVKSEVSKITPQIEKLVNEQLESEYVAALQGALVDAYEADKILLDTYGDTVTIKRPRDGADDDQEPSAGTRPGCQKKRVGKKNIVNLPVLQDHYRGSNLKVVLFIPFHHFINNDLEYLRGGESSRKYSTSVMKTKAADYGHIKWIEDLVPNSMWSQVIVNYDKFALWGISHWGKKRRQFYAFATTRESARDVYSKRRIIAVTKVEIVAMATKLQASDWITVRRECRHSLQVSKKIVFSYVPLRMFTRSVVIQRRVEDLQLGVESYQKKLNLTKPDTYKSNLRRRDTYTPYSDPRGFIYENKDKKNRLMRIDELHKFSDGTLDDVRTALNDRLKGIRMEYLPQTFWSQRDKANARAMIQEIDKRLKTRRIMQSLERFVGVQDHTGGGGLRLLQ
ncbi:hypothetical protein Tco_1401462 [Tanacetum coccineum]